MSAKVKLSHVALAAQHPAELAAFYQAFLGLDVTLEGTLPKLGQFVFLSDSPERNLQTLTFMTQSDAKHVACAQRQLELPTDDN